MTRCRSAPRSTRRSSWPKYGSADDFSFVNGVLGAYVRAKGQDVPEARRAEEEAAASAGEAKAEDEAVRAAKEAAAETAAE